MYLLPITEAEDRSLSRNPVIAQHFTPGEGWADATDNMVATRHLLSSMYRCGVRSVSFEAKRAKRTVLVDFQLRPGGKLA